MKAKNMLILGVVLLVSGISLYHISSEIYQHLISHYMFNYGSSSYEFQINFWGLVQILISPVILFIGIFFMIYGSIKFESDPQISKVNNIDLINDEHVSISAYKDHINQLQMKNDKLTKDKKLFLLLSIVLVVVIAFMFLFMYINTFF